MFRQAKKTYCVKKLLEFQVSKKFVDKLIMKIAEKNVRDNSSNGVQKHMNFVYLN